MSSLANVIVGLDSLNPAELGVVAEVIALRTGNRPPSPSETRSPKRGLFGRRANSESKTPVVLSRSMPGIDPLKWEFVESEEFSELIEAVQACSAPLVYGPGRKQDMLHRVTSVKAAWDHIPERLQLPFRASETRQEGSAPPQTLSEEAHTSERGGGSPHLSELDA